MHAAISSLKAEYVQTDDGKWRLIVHMPQYREDTRVLSVQELPSSNTDFIEVRLARRRNG